MSRRLAIMVAEIPSSETVSAPHLLVIDQDTGKGVKLNLIDSAQQVWRALPDVPLHLLGPDSIPGVNWKIDTALRAIARSLPPANVIGSRTFEKVLLHFTDAKAIIEAVEAAPKGEPERTLEPRTVEDNERHICCGGAKSVGHRAHCLSMKDLHRSSVWERGETDRTVESDLSEDR